jgi:hypothetical protein
LLADKIPFGGRCDFEADWCGWQNNGNAILLWSRHAGPTPTERTGPEFDHTYQDTNVTGMRVIVFTRATNFQLSAFDFLIRLKSNFLASKKT